MYSKWMCFIFSVVLINFKKCYFFILLNLYGLLCCFATVVSVYYK
jgi:hypothetical protein